MKNLLLIDSSVPQHEIFVESVNEDTTPFVYTSETTGEELQFVGSIERVGIVFTLYSNFLNESSFYSETNLTFILAFIQQYQVKHIDYLGCNTLNYPEWRDYYAKISETGVIVGASNNKTGHIQYGGDWIMESTCEDIETIYFTRKIEHYKYLLDVMFRVNLVDLDLLFAPYYSSFAKASNTGYTINNNDLSNLFCPYIAGTTKAAATGYKVNDNDLCNIFLKYGTSIPVSTSGSWNNMISTTYVLNIKYNPNGVFNAIAVSPSGEIYVGGLFNWNSIDGYVAGLNYICLATWYGTGWRILCEVSNSGPCAINTILFDGNNIYIGGIFTLLRYKDPNNNYINVTTSSVAYWNGTQWYAMGAFTIPHSCLSLVKYNGEICAGGSFQLVNGVNTHVARWDGSKWVVLGNGIYNKNMNVKDLIVSPSNVLYATGDFSGRVAYLNGSTWTTLISDVFNSGGCQIAFGLNGDIYIAGRYTLIGTSTANRIIRYYSNGTWTQLSSGVNNDILCVYYYDNSIYVGGSFLNDNGSTTLNRVARYNLNTNSWSMLGSGFTGTCAKILVKDGIVYAGGSFSGWIAKYS